ncbi:Nif3-like dinuclear metal center hexameric protein [Serpentinicella alkaliphila]|uniref:GTP cyclohydrolase 1 type 2 homolog n=1 Tax=Serpentinicella alkaliphila TaxID=1734049 RepID=A0A4R2TYB2_9FIRM|nr:Nif3-like dinuclear metal center hexameric protein [Serpentinicella alkaliphila]QUH26836.1 Nif3-like dinuclear metal center hexameric protein [Serpentinicella alkaliphila]TCQ08062.1 dinuclear metal center YbgI/SA1388 family protein [Serpentinicella alkaliphila]
MSRVRIVTDMIEKLSPKNIAFSWDNVGLQVGSPEAIVGKILICLDVNEKVIDEAINKGVQLIICHHPLIFKPLKNITNESYRGSLIIKAIQNNINIYTAHTNIDGAENGLNAYIGSMFNLKNPSILDPIVDGSIYKVTVFVPKGYEEAVSNEMANVGAGHIGNYSHCTFRTSGEGTFMALEDTNPFIGKKNELAKVEETKIETVVHEKYLRNVLDAMIKAHPYEEVAYDVYKLENPLKPTVGIGRVGILESPLLFKAIIENVKKSFEISHLKVVGNLNGIIKKIAIVNGSGSEYISRAAKLGCDLLITGDVKYHDAQLAEELNINLIDLGHYESEILFNNLIEKYLNQQFIKENINIEIIKSEVNGNPFTVV